MKFTTKDVDENTLNFGISKQDFEGLFHSLGSGTSALSSEPFTNK